MFCLKQISQKKLLQKFNKTFHRNVGASFIVFTYLYVFSVCIRRISRNVIESYWFIRNMNLMRVMHRYRFVSANYLLNLFRNASFLTTKQACIFFEEKIAAIMTCALFLCLVCFKISEMDRNFEFLFFLQRNAYWKQFLQIMMILWFSFILKILKMFLLSFYSKLSQKCHLQSSHATSKK